MKKLQFFLIFILVLTACTSPDSQATTINPDPTPATGVDQKPVGFGLTPDLVSDINQFAPPLKEDFNTYSQIEIEIPESIKSEVERYKTEMIKLIAEVADICVVNANSLKPVFKSNGLTGNDYRWTVVYESPADNATCWSSMLSNGSMGAYPTYFYEEGRIIKVFSKGEGGGWERLDGGKMGFAGTQPVILFEDSYVMPQRVTLRHIENFKTDYGKAPIVAEAPKPAESLFSKADMEIINKAGWSWDVTSGTLNDPNKNEVLLYQSGFLYNGQGNELQAADIKFLSVNGVDEKGNPMKLILERTVKDEQGEHTEIFVQKTNEWRSTVGYEPGLTTETDKTKWNVVTMDDVTSGFLRELKLAQQYKWQEGSIVPNWYVAMVGGRTSAMELTQAGSYGWSEYRDKVFPMAPVDMYWMESPNDSSKQIGIGISENRGPSGVDVVFVAAFGDQQVNGDIQTYLSKYNASLSYLVAVGGNDCANTTLIGGTSNAPIKEACVFWPKDDPRWNFFGPEIFDGGIAYEKSASKPLTISFVAKYQDNVMISLLGY